MGERSVIVVDDDALMVRLLTRFLSTRGWTVRPFGSAPQALASALSDPPTAVVTDWAMPDLGGDDIARVLRARLGDQVPALVLITASRLVAREVEALFDAVLDKPFRLERVQETLDRVAPANAPGSHVRLKRPAHVSPPKKSGGQEGS